MIKIKSVTQGVEKYLDGLEKRERAMQSFLNKNMVEFYKNKQRERWMSEGASEGQAWARLNPEYRKKKLRRFSAYEGGGTKMLIATGALYKSVIGPGPGFKKIATNKTLTIGTTLSYAGYVNDVRPFDKWSEKTKLEAQKMISDFLYKNILRGGTK